MELIVINKGVVDAPDLGRQFVFRSFLNMPLGGAFLYPKDKTPRHVELEMKVLNSEDRSAPVHYSSINQTWPIFWEDDLPEIPVGLFNIYEEIILERMEILEIEPKYKFAHWRMFSTFKQFYKK